MLNKEDDKSIISVPLPEDHDLPQETRDFLKNLPALNVFRMFAHLPQSLPPFIQLAKSFLEQGKFSPRAREIAILRVAYLTKAPYEWHQHVFLGQTAGITDEEMEIVCHENPVRSLNAEENFICQVADELTLTNHLQDETFKNLFSLYNHAQGCELILNIGFYNMVSRFLNGTRTPIETTNPLAGLSSPTSG
ncbi:MAG TPA: carboxymuconolactone decarboxylase family protein [Gammaproteobacteria bacterium]|nr:carboxymuconolactone decarboxylase family protein [Gammaproteobacteria bacterium]